MSENRSIRPYLSLDLETTGLKYWKGHSILTLGAVIDDGKAKTRVGEMEKAHLLLQPSGGRDIVGGPFALALNAKLLDLIARPEADLPEGMQRVTPGEALRRFLQMVKKAEGMARQYDRENGLPEGKLQILGKNPQGFDLPFVDHYFRSELPETVKEGWLEEAVAHRAMDVGSMFVPRFGRNVSLSRINELTGRKAVSHDALEDSIDNVAAIRFACGLPFAL